MNHPYTIPGPIFSEPVFNEGKFLPDPKGFHIPHPSDNATYAKLSNLLYTQTTAIPSSRLALDGLYTLDQLYGAKGPSVVNQIKQAGHITFHMVGDTGAVSAGKYSSELRAADQMVMDFKVNDPTLRPSFFYHLGDIVYDFGEPKYYYDEFYEPYRNYPRPILAIPGNHDSFVLPGTPAGQTPLDVYQRNFCATEPSITAEAYSLHRTAMTQPGAYFTFDAPFVRIIGLFSNALEDPGVISSENGKWANVTDVQLDFLKVQLQRVVTEKYQGAVLLAMHHPPFVYHAADGTSGGNHGSSLNMLHDIDTVCSSVGIYPHAVLSGHAHNYERFTRKIYLKNRSIEVPFVVCGNGGHGVSPIAAANARPAKGADVGYMDANPAITSQGLTIENFDDQNFGYLLLTVDGSHLRIAYNSTAAAGPLPADLVTIDLAQQIRVAN
jgi:Calcineurin-like phosphoesterase